MSENKTAKTPTDSGAGLFDGVWYGTSPTCISSTPLKRQWVGLTDEEIVSATNTVHGFGVIKQRDMNFARSVEAKLKEKNHG